MAESDAVEELLDRAEEHLRELGYNAAYVWSVLSLALSIEWADTDRTLCARCAKRWASRGKTWCFECSDAQLRQLSHKRLWWQRNGQEWRAEWQAQREESDE